MRKACLALFRNLGASEHSRGCQGLCYPGPTPPGVRETPMESHECQGAGAHSASRSGASWGERGLEGCPLTPPPTQRDQDTVSESRTPNKQQQEETTVTLRPGRTLGLGAAWALGVTGVRGPGGGGPASLTGRLLCACRPQSAGSRGRRDARAGSWAGRAPPRGTGPGRSACTCRAPTSAEPPSSPPSGS